MVEMDEGKVIMDYSKNEYTHTHHHQSPSIGMIKACFAMPCHAMLCHAVYCLVIVFGWIYSRVMMMMMYVYVVAVCRQWHWYIGI